MVLRTLTWDEPVAISDVLKMELEQGYCRESVTILSGAGVLDIGTVLGKVTKGSASSAAKSGGNTGNGTLVLDATTPILAGATPGVYSVRFVTTTSIRIESPAGVVLGDTAIGGSEGNSATIAEHIKALVTQGATPFAAGDGFDITIAAGSSKYVAHKNGAVDGSEVACAVLLQKIDATSADAKNVIVLDHGPAIVSRLGLLWDTSVDSEAKKDAAIAQLAERGIKTRLSA